MGSGSHHLTGETWQPVVHVQAFSWVHSWDVRFKIFSLFAFVLGVILLESLVLVLVSLGMVLLVLFSAGIPFIYLFNRVKWIIPFMLFILAGLVLGRGTEHLGDSLYLGGLVGLKALTSLSATFLVMGTQPLNEFLKGLSGLRLPPALVSVLFLSYRYIFLFREVFRDTWRALLSRGFKHELSRQSLKVYGELTGAMFVKALDRSEIVLKSMEARGFDGSLPLGTPGEGKFKATDIVKTAGVIAVALILLYTDRSVF